MVASREEFTGLYRQERAGLERQVTRRTGYGAIARDLVHDVFLRLWEREERPRNPQAFLNRSARNAATDFLRRERVRRENLAHILPEQIAPVPSSALAEIEARQAALQMDAALAALPDRTRHIFLLNRVHGRPFVEIGHLFDLSERGVARHMARALAACQSALDEG